MHNLISSFIISGFILGIVIGSFVGFGWPLVLASVLIGGIFILIWFFERKFIFISMAVLFVSISLGLARYEIKDLNGLNDLDNLVGEKVSLRAVVADEPEEKENYTRFVAESERNKILIYASHSPKFNYGDKLIINGKLQRPRNFDSDFDWKSYLAKDEIYLEMFYPQIEFVSAGNGVWIKEKLFVLKNNFLEAVGKNIPEPDSAFIGGITVGAKSSIPRELTENLKKAGVMHVVVLSGYNITIVADYIMRFFRFLPFNAGIFAGISGIVLFAVMAGASATVVRASIMAGLVLLARATGRLYTASWALVLAGFFMVLHNPKILRFDSSFQLSFLATLGLIFLYPYLEQKLKFITSKYKIREAVCSTLSAQIFVLPLLLYKTGLFSVVSLPVNLLVVMFIPITMFFGFLAGGIGMINLFLAIPFSWIAYTFTRYELGIVNWSAKIPFSATNVSFPFWLMLLCYFAYAVIFFKLKIFEYGKD